MDCYNIIPIVLSMLVFSLCGLACSLVCALIFSGLKGKGHNAGPIFISGFGAHHPGGIILADEECIALKDRNIRRRVIVSY